MYLLHKEIERRMLEIDDKGCHVLKTGKEVAVFFHCSDERFAEIEPEIDRALEDIRKSYNVYCMTEAYYQRQR